MSKPITARRPLQDVQNIHNQADQNNTTTPVTTLKPLLSNPDIPPIKRDSKTIQKPNSKEKSGIPRAKPKPRPMNTTLKPSNTSTAPSQPKPTTTKPTTTTKPGSTRPITTKPTTTKAAKPKLATSGRQPPTAPQPARKTARPKPHVHGPDPIQRRRETNVQQNSRLQQQDLNKENRRRTVTSSFAFTSGTRPNARIETGGVMRAKSTIHNEQINQIAKSQSELLGKVDDIIKSGSNNDDGLFKYLSGINEAIQDLKKDKEANDSSSDIGSVVNEEKYLNLMKENVTLKVEKDQAQQQVEKLESKCSDIEELFEGEKSELNRLQMINEDLKKTIEELKKTNSNQNDQLQQDFDAIQFQLDAMKSASEQAELQHKNLLSNRDSTIANLEEELTTASTKLKGLQRKLGELDDELLIRDTNLRKIERDRDSIKLDRDNIECESNSKEISLRAAEAEIKRIRHEYTKTLKETEINFQQSKGDLSTRITNTENQLNEALKQTDMKSADIAKLTKELRQAREQISSFEESFKEYESRLNKVTADKKLVNLQLDTSNEENERLQANIVKLNKEKSDVENEINELQIQAREDAKQRRKLHNMIQELKGNIRVFCRIRPMLPKEEDNSTQLFEYTDKGQGIVAHTPSDIAGKVQKQQYGFKFDKVFEPSSKQAVVFEEISELVQSALDGYRVCIFAYGQTGSGKTYTMLGQDGNNNSSSGQMPAELGMIPRAVRQIFDSAKEMEKDSWSFKLQASFLEIYNETFRDLLSNNNTTTSSNQHTVSFNAETKLCTVSDITIVDVQDEEQLQQLIEKSMRNRTTASTKANDRSSRSHSVFRLHIVGKNSVTGQELNGLLNLIDLAGSERLNHSKAQGDRLRETRHINKSLSALGDVIAALANKEKHIPFRNSKLTHLLHDSLGGDCKTLMFVNVSHAVESFNESVCSLRFASKVNSCHVGTATRTSRIDL